MATVLRPFERNRDAEDRAGSGRALRPDLAAVQAHEPARERERHSEAADATPGRLGDLLERLEDARDVLTRDRSRCIVNLDAQVPFGSGWTGRSARAQPD